jgi:MscS family membrane protein
MSYQNQPISFFTIQLPFKKDFFSLIITFLLLFLPFFTILAQEKPNRTAPESTKALVDLSSPYHTIYSFLANLQKDNFKPDQAALTFPDMGYTEAEKADLAVKLIQILDGRGIFVHLEALPRQNDYLDSINKKAQYVISERLPQIYIEKIGDKWYFSKSSVEAIALLHKQTYPLGLSKLVKWLQKDAKNQFMGIWLWQYVAVACLILLTFILHKIFSLFFRRILIKFISKLERTDSIKELVQSIANPISLFLVFWLFAKLFPVLSFPVEVTHYVLLAVEVALPIFVMLVALRLVDFVSYHLKRMAANTSTTMDDQLVPLVRKTGKIVVVAVTVIYALQRLEFNITALLAGVSIGTLAFALAAQDTIRNLFGSIMIFVDRPFQVGDWINLSGLEGTVEEVGFRSTRIRTFYDSVISIPNGKLADMTIDNMGLRRYRRYRTMLTLTYDTPPALLEAFILGVRQIIEAHPHTRKDNYAVYFNEFGSTYLGVLLNTFFITPDTPTELAAKQELMLQILRLAEELGVRFAFPTQTLHIEDFPEKQSLKPTFQTEKLQKNVLEEQVAAFIRKIEAQNKEREEKEKGW